MSKSPVQASGGGKPRRGDGVSEPDGGGRTGGGESGGGAYVEPDQVKGDPDQGISGRSHGGQSKMAYHGSGDAEDGGGNPNAATQED